MEFNIDFTKTIHELIGDKAIIDLKNKRIIMAGKISDVVDLIKKLPPYYDEKVIWKILFEPIDCSINDIVFLNLHHETVIDIVSINPFKFIEKEGIDIYSTNTWIRKFDKYEEYSNKLENFKYNVEAINSGMIKENSVVDFIIKQPLQNHIELIMENIKDQLE